MKDHTHEIVRVIPGSIADECGLAAGDRILAINDCEIKDIFDYQYHIENEYLELLISTAQGEEYLLEIEKDEEEDLGILFALNDSCRVGKIRIHVDRV